jgi:hypothetical protein
MDAATSPTPASTASQASSANRACTAATATTQQFTEAARTLARAARSAGLGVPTFKSPPKLPVDRTLRRTGAGVVVAVRVRGRPFVAVAADLIEGVIVANQLAGPDALRARGALWAALGFAVAAPVPAPVAPSVPRVA